MHWNLLVRQVGRHLAQCIHRPAGTAFGQIIPLVFGTIFEDGDQSNLYSKLIGKIKANAIIIMFVQILGFNIE